MADVGHLEKMGRELKCPICLSLLNSSASLGCNHVFCNSCILESMKSASDCPVCKVPFRRREVRAAPHMDNLVSIYRSMEVASGVNIFTTQAAPSTKKSEDGLVGVNGENSSSPKTSIARRRKSNGKRSSRSKQQKNEKADVRSIAKKRIHVTPFPVSETPFQPEKVSKSDNTSKEIVADKQGDSLFSPFFWLREENDDDEAPEKLSAQQTQDASPPRNVPCFSDINDYDDDAALTKMTPISKSNVAETFDSEMFEWTQRACSPELCSTPLKKQTAGRHWPDRVHEKDGMESSATQSNMNVEASSAVDARRGTHKKKKIPNCKVQSKQVEASVPRTNAGSIDEVLPEVLVDSIPTLSNSNQENVDTEQNQPQSPGIKGNRKSNMPTNHYRRKYLKNPMAEALEQLPITINTGKNQNQEREGTGIVSPVLPCIEATDDIVPDSQNKTDKRSKRTMLQSQRKRMKTSMDGYLAKTPEAVPATPVNEAKIQNLQVLSGIHSENKEPSSNGRSRQCKELQKKSKELKEQRLGETVAVGVRDADKMPLTSMVTAECESKQTATKSSKKTKDSRLTSGINVMRKCENINFQIRCAFCQSPNDTEASGEMMHYFNGKPVAADYNGGVNVIHSHKNCTEWAPDVYFEDDLAINLPAELARSRRIKCSCCSIKGAALGCYEKSCRRSFHVTCAKLIPECRWDNENFVMLCPLHSSSKLPCETSKPCRHFRKRYTAEEELQAPFVRKPGPDTSQKWRWPSGSPCKWVICCSALTIAEKEIIYQFARLAGVPISKAWTPAVTHVVASTDVNGSCKRTLKFLKGILDGKWILSIDWIKACMNVMEPVDEENFEITLDIHGIIGGPREGRLRITNKQPKLFNGFRFYFAGDFQPSYKGYLQDLVIAAGGIVLQRKPVSRAQEKLLDDSPMSKTLIIYTLEAPENYNREITAFDRRRTEAQALADVCGAQVVGNSWILDSIAGCKLQPLA